MRPLILLLALPASAIAQAPALLPEPTVSALAQELSGETATWNLEYLTRLHRMPGSPAFHEAITFLAERARQAGLSEVRVDSFPADGERFYGTQRSRPAWFADFAELWELEAVAGKWIPAVRLASWEAMPIRLADMGENGEVEAELVDVGNGTSEADYAGKDVRGKLILAAQQPASVAPLGLARHGAAGIVSYAQNQRQAWWGEDENLIRWGHFDAFEPSNTFAFMLSLKEARALRDRLAQGETIRLKATVRGSGRQPGYYEVLSATIPGGDPVLREQEIVYSCHLDHQRPGANDNASGCVTIMEVARAVQKLIVEGKVARPARTLRFVWPPEIEGTFALLTSRPELARRFKAVIHMDMVGGGPVTKASFRIHRGPAHLPSVVSDVAEAWGDFVNQQSARFAAGTPADYPLVAPEGGKEPFQAILDEFDLGSDHEIYEDASWGIPGIYLAQWPDRYIHTNRDVAANIDPTVVKRAAFVGAASGLTLAGLDQAGLGQLWPVIQTRALARAATMVDRRTRLAATDAGAMTRFHWTSERAVLASLARFVAVPVALHSRGEAFYDGLEAATGGQPASLPAAVGPAAVVYRRNPEIKGPMSAFGYDYFSEHYGPDRAAGVRLLGYQGLWGDGSHYAYEGLNLVDGKRTVQEIRDALTATYGPIPLEVVAEYLGALASIEVIR